MPQYDYDDYDSENIGKMLGFSRPDEESNKQPLLVGAIAASKVVWEGLKTTLSRICMRSEG